MNTTLFVRQGEFRDRWSEQDDDGAGRGPPAAGPHSGVDPQRARACRAVPIRAGQIRRDREVHAVPAGVRHGQPEPGDAVGAERRAGRSVQPAGGPSAPPPGDRAAPRRRHHGAIRARPLRGYPAGVLPAERPPGHLPAARGTRPAARVRAAHAGHHGARGRRLRAGARRADRRSPSSWDPAITCPIPATCRTSATRSNPAPPSSWPSSTSSRPPARRRSASAGSPPAQLPLAR